MHRYNLGSELRAETYSQLLEHASKKGLQLLLIDVCRVPSKERVSFLSQMAPYLVRSSEQSSWPGTRLTEGTARVYWYTLNEESIATLLSRSSGLSDWRQPDLLEDLCLIRSDGSPFFTSTSSEGDAYFDLADGEHSELLANVQGIDLQLEERLRTRKD